MTLVVIDGDIISYSASAASEKRTVLASNKDSGKTKEFAHRTEFKAWALENNKNLEGYTIEDVQTPEPIEYCLHTVKRMIENIHNMSGCKEVKVVVQGDGNFRDDLLLPTKYKSNRVGVQKPIHLVEAKNYLLGKYKAERANGRESDDVLSSYAWDGFKSKTKIVQATRDKDSLQCTGWLLNWDKMKTPQFISGLGEIDSKGKGFGRKFLYMQQSVGDPSDCYKPTELVKYKYGVASAYKDFGQLTTDKECWGKLKELYQTWYPEPFEYTAWNGQVVQGNWLQMLQLYTSCAHMQRWENDCLDVENTLEKMGLL